MVFRSSSFCLLGWEKIVIKIHDSCKQVAERRNKVVWWRGLEQISYMTLLIRTNSDLTRSAVDELRLLEVYAPLLASLSELRNAQCTMYVVPISWAQKVYKLVTAIKAAFARL